MKTRLLDAGFAGSILNEWIRRARVVRFFIANHIYFIVKNSVQSPASISTIQGPVGLFIDWSRKILLLLRKVKYLGIKGLKMKMPLIGRVIELDTQVFTIGWSGNLESLGYANNVELDELKNTTGLIRVEPIKGIYQTGNDCA